MDLTVLGFSSRVRRLLRNNGCQLLLSVWKRIAHIELCLDSDLRL